jgi:hypothetical protein
MNAPANTADHTAGELISLDEFLSQLGRTAITAWRWRRRGMIQTVEVSGIRTFPRGEIARFEARAARGEFARNTRHTQPADELVK